MALPLRTQPVWTDYIGTQAAQPASGSVVMRGGVNRFTGDFRLTFTLNAARITVTDAGVSGSSGSLLLFTFIPSVMLPLASSQVYTAFAEGTALTTAAGDAAFVLALGSAAANAGDGALTGTEVDIAAATGTLTNSGGTTTGTKFSAIGTTAPLDGRSSAVTVYLNWSGTAATIDANSTIDVTGVITIAGKLWTTTGNLP